MSQQDKELLYPGTVLFIPHDSGGLMPLVLYKWQCLDIYYLLHLICFCVKLRNNGHSCKWTILTSVELQQQHNWKSQRIWKIQGIRAADPTTFTSRLSQSFLLPHFPPSLKPKSHHEVTFLTQSERLSWAQQYCTKYQRKSPNVEFITH